MNIVNQTLNPNKIHPITMLPLGFVLRIKLKSPNPIAKPKRIKPICRAIIMFTMKLNTLSA